MRLTRRQWLALGASPFLTGCRPDSMKTCNVVWTGTSITAGNHVSAGECYPELIAAALPSIVSHNIAVPSSTLDSGGQGATADGWYDSGKQVNICVVEFGVNDGLSVSSSTFLSTLDTFCAARQTTGFKVIVLTMLPCNSYDSAAFRSAINSGERNDPTIYDRLIDIGHTSTTMGVESAKTDTSLYSDGVHPTALGNTLIQPAIQRGIQALIADQVLASVFAGVLR